MNYLELVQKLWQESGSGGTMPTTVVGQTGEKGRLVQWVRSADLFLQSLYSDWNFLWAQQTITTAIGTATYAPGAAVGEFDRDAWFLDDQELVSVEYIEVKETPRPTTNGQPYQAVIMPDRRVRFDPTPGAIYTVRFDYWIPATYMEVANETESIIPVEFREAIVGKALMMYAEYEAAPEVMEKGTRMLGDWLTALQAKQLPGDRYMHKVSEGNHMAIVVE